MFHWLIIILGILILSLSISSPFYKLIIRKFITFKVIFEIFFRIILFVLSIVIIVLGLYVESIP